MKTADTVWGKIFIYVAGAAVLGVLGWLGTMFVAWLTPDAPQVAVQPEAMEVSIRMPATVTAAVTPSRLTPSWEYAGSSAETSRLAHCRVRGDSGKTLICVPFIIGDYAVTATASNGYSASTAINVTEPGFYIGLLFRPEGVPERDDEFARVLMHAVDWRAIEAEIGHPIMLYDPETAGTIYASMVERDIEVDIGALWDRNLLVVGASGEWAQALYSALSEVGLSIIILPPSHILPALEAGQSDTALTTFSSSEDYRTALEEFLGEPVRDVATN